jgi:transcriptional regulator with XRE-family HTH domain
VNEARTDVALLNWSEQLVKGGNMGRRIKFYDFAAQVGARIQILRLERGLSLRMLAAIAKCCPFSISRIETGRSSVRMQMLRKLARALEVEPIDLLNVDSENDDVGYVIEKIRQDPESRAAVKAQLEAWDLMVRTPE